MNYKWHANIHVQIFIAIILTVSSIYSEQFQEFTDIIRVKLPLCLIKKAPRH
jgi:hypothetical protein